MERGRYERKEGLKMKTKGNEKRKLALIQCKNEIKNR